MHELGKKSLEQTLKELKNHYQLVEETILHINSCRQQVDDYANKARLDVRSEINSILDHIRQREIQLLRQIDIIHSHYGDAFHIQNAKLHQFLGTLKHVLHSFEGRQPDATGAITPEDLQFVEEVRRQKLLPNTIAYQGNVEELFQFIEKFGTLTSPPGFCTWHSPEELMSKCLPSNFEDYDDADHQLLFKTLYDRQLEQIGELKEQATFKEMIVDDWLKPSLAIPQNKNCSIPVHEGFLMENNSYWLKESLKEMNLEDDNKSFEMISSASECDSIEFLTNPTPSSAFRSTDSLGPSILSLTKSCCKDRGGCASIQSTVDIENLGPALCGSGNFPCNEYVSKWLVKQDSNDSVNTLVKCGVLQMDDVCMANECCADFSECVCKERCFSKACEVIDDHMSKLQIDVSEWLKSPNSSHVNWLKSVSVVDDEKLDCSEKKVENSSLNDTDSYKWFKSSSACLTSNLNLNYPVKTDLNWLNIDTNPDYKQSFIRKDFERYFSNSDQKAWLPLKNI